MMYMLNTNICIYIIKQKPKSVIDKFKKMNNANICISSITYSELLYGAEKSSNIAKNLLALTIFYQILKFCYMTKVHLLTTE